MGGIGWQSTRFSGYQPTSNCVPLGACYTSSNHLLVTRGGGIGYYFFGQAFIGPKARFFHILNHPDNRQSHPRRTSIGYTIDPE